jgi:methionyl-tRNA formyltransferase
VTIATAEDYGALSARLAELGAELLLRALDLEAAGELELIEQDESFATYADKITPAERRLDPTRTAAELERTVRALSPHLGAYLELDDGQRLAVLEAEAEPASLEPSRLVAEGGTLRLGCVQGALRLGRVQPAGGRPMAVDAYLRGHQPPQLAR